MEVEQRCGAETFEILRYLGMLFRMFAVLGIFLIPVLIPLNFVDGKGTRHVSSTSSQRWNVTGLDQLAWGNVQPKHSERYWAHLIMALATILWTSFCIGSELKCHIKRQIHRQSLVSVATFKAVSPEAKEPSRPTSRTHNSASPMKSQQLEMHPQDFSGGSPRRRDTWWGLCLRDITYALAMFTTLSLAAVLIAISGAISQLSYIADRIGLAKFNESPQWVVSSVQGLVPPLCVMLIMALVPRCLRALSLIQGFRRGPWIEPLLQQYYFAFLFFELFVVVCITCSISTVLQDFTDISRLPPLLAENIPKSSNYFMSYMALQAMSTSAGEMAQPMRLFKFFRDRVPPEPDAVEWGTVLPHYTTLACIGKLIPIFCYG